MSYQTTVYSLMKKFEGEKVIEIDRDAEEVAIPPTATRICEVACFFGSIKSLDIENTLITIIEKHAFANCYNLGEVRFPSCLEEICEGAFKQCTSLKHISFPSDSKLRKIGDNAFRWCYKLESFEFPHFLEFIGDFVVSSSKLKLFDLRETNIRHIGINDHLNPTIFNLPNTVSTYDILKLLEDFENELNVDESHPIVRRDSCRYFFSNGTISQWRNPPEHVLIRRGVERIAKYCFYRSRFKSITIPSSVTIIDDYALSGCFQLQRLRFHEDSRLKVIGKCAFQSCSLLTIFKFPRSLKIIKSGAFEGCESLERVVFPNDSQLERIEGAFKETAIKRLSLPPSVREIVDVSGGMDKLESIFVSNDLFQSNEEGSAIFSRDGSELVFVIMTLKQFEIPDSVRVIKKRAFYWSSITGHIIIPPSVEVIEEEAFLCYGIQIIEFQSGSRLKSLAIDAFNYKLEELIIHSNENLIMMENGVVMSLNPRGIVFVPSNLTELEVPPGIEVIYSFAFFISKIKSLKFPKSLKKIGFNAFYRSFVESVTFEEGTELDFIGAEAFAAPELKFLELPLIKGDIDLHSFDSDIEIIKFPPNMEIESKELRLEAKKIICPYSSLPVIANFEFYHPNPTLIIENH